MIYFDSECREMTLPDGTSFDISTKKGAKAFLRRVSNFDFFSSKVMELEYIRPEDRDRSIEHVACLLGKNVSMELFREMIPVLEIECWFQHAIAELQTLATKPSWIPEKKLQEHDKMVLNQCSAMFLHTLPVALAFESNYFQVLTEFVKARKDGNLPSQSICELVLSIVSNAFVTSTSRSTTRWPSKTVFKQLASRGVLEQFLRCLMVPKLEALLSDRIETMLQQLQLCPTFLKRKFKIGDPCGDAVRAVLEDKAGIRETRANIFQRLENIVLSVDSMVIRRCIHCGKYDESETCQTTHMFCSRCRNACYCSRECQMADWNRHRWRCSSVRRDIAISLNALSSRLSNFMKSNYAMMMVKMVEECDKTGLKMKDMVIQLDFMPDEDGIIPALQDPPIFKIAPIRDHIEGSPPKEPKNWYHSRGGKYTYLCIDPLKKLKSNPRPDDVTFLVRCEDAIQCFNITMEKRGTEETVSAFRRAIRDRDFGPLSQIFDGEESGNLSSQIRCLQHENTEEDSS